MRTEAVDMNFPAGVTVIIPTRDRPAALRRCISALSESRHPNFEVIVADQSDCDCSADVVAAAGDPRVRYRRLHTKGKAKALNAAIADASHELLALVDDDIEVTPSWLADGTTLMTNNSQVALIFGAVRAAQHDPRETYIPEFLPHKQEILTSRTALRLPGTGMGANAFVRRSEVCAVGGWNESLGPGSFGRSGDDWDLAYRLLRRRRAVLVTPWLEVRHAGARQYADGSARRLIENNYHGVGVGLGCYIKRGDLGAAMALARAVIASATTIAWRAATGRRPTGLRALAALTVGFRKSWEGQL